MEKIVKIAVITMLKIIKPIVRNAWDNVKRNGRKMTKSPSPKGDGFF